MYGIAAGIHTRTRTHTASQPMHWHTASQPIHWHTASQPMHCILRFCKALYTGHHRSCMYTASQVLHVHGITGPACPRHHSAVVPVPSFYSIDICRGVGVPRMHTVPRMRACVRSHGACLHACSPARACADRPGIMAYVVMARAWKATPMRYGLCSYGTGHGGDADEVWPM